MNRTEFIEEIVELGFDLLKAQKSDPKRQQFIIEVADLGEELLQSQQADLRVFEEEFIRAPDGFRWELLGQTALARKALSPWDIRQLDILGFEPDLLGPLGQLRKETAHTRALAWALNPAKTWLGHAPLRTFLQCVEQLRQEGSKDEEVAISWQSDELGEAKIRAEHYLPSYGRADISIELPRLFILVEAKIDAGQREKQIEDYQAAAKAMAKARNKAWLVVFLTADPEEKPSVATPHLTFRQLLRNWLPIAASLDTPEHTYLKQYLASVARVVDEGEPGAFDAWNFARRRKAINFISGKVWR